MKRCLLAILVGLFLFSAFSAWAGNVALPTCDSQILLDSIHAKIQEYNLAHSAENLVDRRQQILTLKNLNSFEETSVEEFTPQTDYNVANRIITAKINEHLEASDMRLCKSSNSLLSLPIYVLLRPFEGAVMVDIINFIPDSRAGQSFYTIIK